MKSLQIGDWVQAVDVIKERDFMGERQWIHATPGAIGHVWGLRGNQATVTWERTGTTTEVLLEEIKFLCNPNAGKVM